MEVDCIFMGGCTSLVKVQHSFCTMNEKTNTQEDPTTNLLCSLMKYVMLWKPIIAAENTGTAYRDGRECQQRCVLPTVFLSHLSRPRGVRTGRGWDAVVSQQTTLTWRLCSFPREYKMLDNVFVRERKMCLWRQWWRMKLAIWFRLYG